MVEERYRPGDRLLVSRPMALVPPYAVVEAEVGHGIRTLAPPILLQQKRVLQGLVLLAVDFPEIAVNPTCSPAEVDFVAEQGEVRLVPWVAFVDCYLIAKILVRPTHWVLQPSPRWKPQEPPVVVPLTSGENLGPPFLGSDRQVGDFLP